MALTKVTYGLLSADTSAIDLNIDANTLYVDSSANRVGIGTSSPGVHLDIESSTNNAQIEITATDGTDQSYGIFGATGNNSNGAGFYIQDKTASGSPIRFKIDSSGNVGIGTTSPSKLLHIKSADPVIRLEDSSPSAYAEIDGAGGDLIISCDAGDNDANSVIQFKVDNSEKMRIDSFGNMGLRGAPPSDANSNYPLMAVGTSTFIQGLNDSNESFFGNNSYWANDNSWHRATVGKPAQIAFADGETLFRTSSSAGSGSNISWTESARFTNNGNLKFVGQTTNFESPGFTYHTNNYLYLRGGSSGLILSDDSGINTVQIIDGSSGYINFETADGSSRMRITSTGKVGIGTTSPQDTLHVYNGDIGIENSSGRRYRLIAESSGGFTIRDQSAAAGRLAIDTSGKIGIGTASPNANLHVGSSAATGSSANPAIQIGGAGTYRLGLYTDSEGGIIQNLNGDNGLQFRVKTAGEVMRIMPSGNVGIGVTNPAYKLAVSSKLVVGDNPGVGLSGNTIHVREGSNSGIHFPLVIGGGTHTAGAAFGIGLDPEGYGNRNKIAILAEGIGTGYSRGRLHFALDNANDSGQVTLADSKMCITESGHIGIGDQVDGPTFRLDVQSNGSQVRIRETTTSGYATLRVQAAGNTHGLEIDCFGTTSGGAYGVGSGGCAIVNVNNTPLAFGVANSADMTIVAGGGVYVGTQQEPNGSTGGAGFSPDNNNRRNFICATTGTGTLELIEFRNPNGTVGDIRTSGSATSYTTSSDYRLKENEIAVWDGTTILKQLIPYKFNWKADPTGEAVQGFFAHEVAEVVPAAVHGEKDGEKMQGIDHSKLVPLLVKTIQELEARITELESK